jgi:hypothetical protein
MFAIIDYIEFRFTAKSMDKTSDLPPEHVPHSELEFCHFKGSPKTGPILGGAGQNTSASMH